MLDPLYTIVREFRRVQIDMSGNRKVLLVQEWQVDGKTLFVYTEECGDGRNLVSDNGKLNYIQFLRELENRDGRSA